METLPSELLDLIVTHCDHGSQKALRSVNQHFQDLATPSVFAELYIAPCIFDEALRKLEAISQSKRKLANHIKTLIFYADILPPWDRHEWEAQASTDTVWNHATNILLSNHLPDYKNQPPQADEKRLDISWRNFQALCNRQAEWYFDNENYQRIFKEAISSLPNLTKASVGVAEPCEGSTSCWPVWGRLKREMLVSPGDWVFEEEAEYRWNDNRMAQTTRAALNLLEAIGFRSSFAGVTPVQTLSVHTLNNGRLETLMSGLTADDSKLTFSPRIESCFQTLLGAFAHLTDLDLQIPHPVTETDRPLSDVERDKLLELNGRETTSILTHAKNLKRLRLEYDSESGAFWEPGEEALHPLRPLFQATTNPWPKLETLTISVNLPYTLLLSLLSLLSPTLRNLSLLDMCVYDAQALFAELPKAIKLENIYIECLWTKINVRYANIHAPPTTYIINQGLDVDEAYERELKAYLLGRAEDFPRLRGRLFLEDDEVGEEENVP